MNWETVCKPKVHRGAGISDPRKMNLALGAKILCRIVTGKGAWWKKILQKKHLSGNRKRCLDEICMSRKGSSIPEMCKNATYIITEELKWSPSNGKEIRIWTDHYTSVSPVVLSQVFPKLRKRLEGMNIKLLHGISE